MTCRRPPELASTELLAYLDGEADRQVRAHVEACPHCRQRAVDLAQWQGELTARLYRFACPTPLELGEYHLGTLARDRSQAIAGHLAGCPHCTRELVDLEDYLHQVAPSLEPARLELIKEQIRVIVARLVSGAGAPGPLTGPSLAPAFAGLRGAEEGPYLYEAGEIQIAVEVQDDTTRPGGKAILGLVMGAEPIGGLALLWQAEQQVAEAPVDELGNFVIPDLDPGSYQLILSSPQVEVHIHDLQVGAR